MTRDRRRRDLVVHSILMLNQVCLALEHPSRVEKVEHSTGQDHHGTVKDSKESFVRHKVSRPALREFNGAVQISNNDNGRGEDRSPEKLLDVGRHGDLARLPNSADEEDHENQHAGKLDDDAGNHDVRARFCAALGSHATRSGCHSTTDGLNDEGCDVDAEEDEQIALERDQAVLVTPDAHESAENVVDSGAEERRTEDQDCDLDHEDGSVVGAFVCGKTCCPS